MVSDKEIEAAARAVATADWRFEIDEFREPKRWTEAVDAYNLINNNWRFRYDEIARAALSAAARVRAEANAEPVAWRYRYTDPVSGKPVWRYDNHLWNGQRPSERQALYARPALQPSGPVEVKPLEWVKRGNDYFADTVVGQYCVGLVHTSFRTVLRCITQGQWADIEVSGDDGLEDARDAAQADYERRILSALTAGKPEQVPSGTVEALPYDEAMRVMASLAAAISLLERGPKTAAPSDRMFDQMLTDYRNALDAARSALTAGKPEQAVASGPKRKPLSDWSVLPRDIYVTAAASLDGGIGYDVQCCSVPMAMAPEVRYVRADLIDAQSKTSQKSRYECPTCDGSGEIAPDGECPDCDGTGACVPAAPTAGGGDA